MGLTPSEEEYLEAIYRCQHKTKGKVKISELSKCLHLRAPSVVQMLRKLKKRNLISYERSGVELTEKGKKEALRVIRRHELAERLLTDIFGHELPKVHDWACKFEHVLDDELTNRIEEVLGKPSTCPHGNPIPTPDGRVSKLEGDKLTRVAEGSACEVVSIPQERESVERLLAFNILPGSKLQVIEKLPRGALVVRCGRCQVALSRGMASRILVKKHLKFRG